VTPRIPCSAFKDIPGAGGRLRGVRAEDHPRAGLGRPHPAREIRDKERRRRWQSGSQEARKSTRTSGGASERRERYDGLILADFWTSRFSEAPETRLPRLLRLGILHP